jgi:hypothetical protein
MDILLFKFVIMDYYTDKIPINGVIIRNNQIIQSVFYAYYSGSKIRGVDLR